MGIIVIFVAIVTAVYSNLSMSNIKIERMQRATNCAIAIFEKIDKLYYGEVQIGQTVISKESQDRKILEVDVPKGYSVSLSINNSTETNLIKTVEIEIKYNVGNKEETIKMDKLKQKENISTPNKPIIENEMKPVKYTQVAKSVKTTDNESNESYTAVYEKKLIETNVKDEDWYDYSNKKWALAKDTEDNIYAWIPKFAYHQAESEKDIKFLYVNGKRFINNIGNLERLSEESYTIPDSFGDKTGKWVLITTITNNENATDIGSILNNSSKFGPISN